MKTEFNAIHCPYCGSSSFTFPDINVFLCDYCKKSFSFDFDHIVIQENNAACIAELKDVLNKKKEDLEQNKLYQKQKLEFYAKKASQKKSELIVAIAWILSVIFLISAFTAPVMLIFSMIGCLFAIGLRVYRKKMYKKYQPMVLFYAAEVVKYEDKINLYNTLISKLTK